MVGLASDEEIANCRELLAKHWEAIDSYASERRKQQQQQQDAGETPEGPSSGESKLDAVCARIRRLCLSELK